MPEDRTVVRHRERGKHHYDTGRRIGMTAVAVCGQQVREYQTLPEAKTAPEDLCIRCARTVLTLP